MLFSCWRCEWSRLSGWSCCKRLGGRLNRLYCLTGHQAMGTVGHNNILGLQRAADQHPVGLLVNNFYGLGLNHIPPLVAGD